MDSRVGIPRKSGANEPSAMSRSALWNKLKWGLLVSIALLPIGLLALFSFRFAAGSVRQLVRANNQAAATITAELVSRDLENSLNLAQTFAALPGLIEQVELHDEEGVRRHLKVAVETNPRVDRAFVLDPQGRLWSDYPRAPESLGQNFSHRDYFRGVSQRWAPYVSEVFQRQAAPKPLVVALAAPVRNSEQVVTGVLVYQYRLEGVTEWLKQITVGTNGYVFVLDHTGTVAAHPKLNLQERKYSEYVAI